MQRAQKENEKRLNTDLEQWDKEHGNNPKSKEAKQDLKKIVEREANFIAQQKVVNLSDHSMPCFRNSFRNRAG